MTVFELRFELERILSAVTPVPTAETRWLLEHVLGLDSVGLLTAQRQVLSETQLTQLRSLAMRRVRGEPLQHVLGEAEFYGLKLRVTPDVLVPRPETERLVIYALDRLAPVAEPAVLDVGTGSGALALAMKRERPDAKVWASDISAEALSVAAENAERLGLELACVRSDLLAARDLRELAPRLDMLVSNPPYLPDADLLSLSPEVRRDPPGALFAGPDGLDVFRRLLAEAETHLKPGAWLLAELDPRNVGAAAELAERWQSREILLDLTGRRRFLALNR